MNPSFYNKQLYGNKYYETTPRSAKILNHSFSDSLISTYDP